MAYPAFFRGGSPDIAIGREDAYRNYLTQSNESNRAAQMRAEETSLQAFLQNQAREDQLREQDISRNFQADVANRDFFGRQSEIAAQREENRPYREATVKDIEAQTKARSENPLLKLGHSLAEKAAENGLIISPEAAAKSFGIPLVEAQIFHGRSKQVQEEIDQQDAAYQAAADTLTRYSEADKGIKGIPEAYNPEAQIAKAAELKRLTDIKQQLQKRVDYLQNPKRQDILDRLEQDDTGAYFYKAPPRPWRTQAPQTSTGTTPPAFFAPPAQAQQPIVPPLPAQAGGPPSFFTGETANPVGMRGGQRFDFGGTDRSTLPSWVAPPPPAPTPQLRPITREIAVGFLKQARGDRALARKLARDAGFSF